jgi:hypothetical protein
MVLRLAQYVWYSVKVLLRTENHLGDNAAATSAGSSTVGIDGSRRRGLSLGGFEGSGEESSEEIH